MKKGNYMIIAVMFSLFSFGPAAWAQLEEENYEADRIMYGEYSEAEKNLITALEENPNDPFALLNLAALYQSVGADDKARGVYERILSLEQNPHAQLASGKAEKVKSIAQRGLTTIRRR